MNLPDDLSKLILVSVRIPGLELEPANPAHLLDVLAGGVFRELFIVELAAELLLPERPVSGPTSFMGHFMFVVGGRANGRNPYPISLAADST